MVGEPGTTTPSSWPWNGRPSLSFPRDSRPSLSRSTCSSFPRNIRSSFPRRRESSHFRDPTHHSTAKQLDSRLRGNDEQQHSRSEEHTSELQSLMRNSYAVL